MTEIKKWADCQTIDDVLLKCAAVALNGEPEPDQVPSLAELEAFTSAWSDDDVDVLSQVKFLLLMPSSEAEKDTSFIMLLHYRWLILRQVKPTLAYWAIPIVKAWQQRPTPVDADRGNKPIMAKTLLERFGRDTPPAPLLHVVQMPGLAQGDLFQPSRGDVPALIKTLHDLAGEEGTRQGRAPLAAVMGLEALLAIPTQYRDGRLHELAITRKAIYRDWGGCDPRNFNHREAKRQDKALARISALTVAAGRGWYKPLMVQAIEGPKLNDRVLFVVRLPPEAQQGPAIPRPLLRKVVQSRLAWLGLANLCIHFDRYGATKGHLTAATRPEVERDGQGRILDHQGQVLRYPDGKPVALYRDKRAIQTGKRERNPGALQAYPVLHKAELMALFYPLNPPTSAQQGYDQWQYTMAALKKLEAVGAIETERTRQGWRVMPGKWSMGPHRPQT